MVVGWSDPEGSRHRIGSLLLGYYTPEGKLIYAGRAGTGLPEAELERLWQRLQPLVIDKMPLDHLDGYWLARHLRARRDPSA